MPGVECDPLSSFPRPSVTSDLPTGIFIFINLFTLCSLFAEGRTQPDYSQSLPEGGPAACPCSGFLGG